MASPESTAQVAAEETEAIVAAATKAQPDPAPDAARDAELARQAGVVAAVAKAHDKELPSLGGPLLEPGLGR